MWWCLHLLQKLFTFASFIQYLQECINFEFNIGGKICNFISLYRSPSQTQDEFEKFIDNLELNLETLCQNNPFLIVLIGNLNAKSKNWYFHDKTSHEGTEIENVTAQFGLQQIIKEPIHISNTSSSCVDLIFTSQPNLITDSGVHSSLHSNCHRQMTKVNVHVAYPPPYLREIWHYREANTRLIRRVIKEFNWDKAFSNTNVNEKVDIFNRTILNILSNFISHETIVCNDKDPPWFNNRIKTLIKEKNVTYKIFRHNKDNPNLIYRLKFLQERLSTITESSKERYYARIANKLNNTQKSSKTYWSLLKIFLNNKKIPLIPPLFHENRFITDFKEKAQIFNSLFSDQCSFLKNCSKIPTNLRYVTDKRLRTINFTTNNIEKIIVSLNPNKTHSHDNISIRMLKIYGNTICKPLELIFKQALTTGVFPSEWKKKAILSLVTKKATNKTLKITVQFLYYLSAENFLKDSYLMKCLFSF